MTTLQQKFFLELKQIQEDEVLIKLSKKDRYENMEDILTDITYDTIFRIMELIDGYRNDGLQLDLIDKNTFESIKNGIELHDQCPEFLKCTDI